MGGLLDFSPNPSIRELSGACGFVITGDWDLDLGLTSLENETAERGANDVIT